MTDRREGSIERGPGAHLSEADIAGYLDRDLLSSERQRVEAHIEGCTACRGELVALSRIVQDKTPVRAEPRRQRRWWIPVAAAVAATWLLVPRLTTNTPGPDESPRTRRTVDGDGRSRIAVVAPADSVIADTHPRFTWRAVSADVYRVYVLTPSGDSVWTGETSDTTIALPDSAPLQPGRTYLWHVDGIGSGIDARSDVRQLQISAR